MLYKTLNIKYQTLEKIVDFIPPYLLVVTLGLWLLSYKNLF